MREIFITGGAGYIGSHIALTLLMEDKRVIVLDNLSNSNVASLKRVEALTNKKIFFYQGDIRAPEDIDKVFKNHRIDCVIHMAGVKSVSESVNLPCYYYQNNVTGTLNLLERMQAYGIRNLIFSSSATVYGPACKIPVSESSPCGGTTTPYGTTKLVAEQFLHEVVRANSALAITALRYFNPAGAHASGEIGEDPKGVPNNLLPYVFQVGMGKLPYVSVYGNDYPTPDGTGIRDYIHVMDLAEGHVKALGKLAPGIQIYNLGTGKGHSVYDVINTFEKVAGQKIPYQIEPRRRGDVAACLSDPSLANHQLEWCAKRDLECMIRDAWRWHTNNPEGYLIN